MKVHTISLLATSAVLLSFAACSEGTLDSSSSFAVSQQAIDARQTAEALKSRADEAARQAHAAEEHATAIVQSTRNALDFQSTQVALSGRATMQSADAQATAIARSAAQTATADSAQATSTERSVVQTATTEAERTQAAVTAASAAATATAVVRESTADAVAATSTQVAVQATGTAISLESAVQATRTANRIAEEVAQSQANQNMQMASSFFWSVFWFALPVIFVALLVWSSIHIVRAIALRQLVLRNATGDAVGIIIPPTAKGQPLMIHQIGPLPTTPLLEAGMPESVAEGECREEEPPLVSRPLVLSEQPKPLFVPIGVTRTKPEGWWISIADVDSALIAGARRLGKSNFMHSWIQSLCHGRSVRLVLFDGKNGVEFGRYVNQPRTQVVNGPLAPLLGDLLAEMQRRIDIFRGDSVSNITEFNEIHGTGGRLERICIFIDELGFALREKGVESILVDLIARGGAFGLYLVAATQRPGSDTITSNLKANLTTRIALPVVSLSDSRIILDHGGAEKLPKTPGRGLIAWNGELVEFQSFEALKEMPGGRRERALISPVLTEREIKLAEAALRQGGWFKQAQIVELTGESSRYVAETALRWQALGYLSVVLRTSTGQNQGRQITDRLRRLITRESGNGVDQVHAA